MLYPVEERGWMDDASWMNAVWGVYSGAPPNPTPGSRWRGTDLDPAFPDRLAWERHRFNLSKPLKLC